MVLDLKRETCLCRRMPEANECIYANVAEGSRTVRLLQPHSYWNEPGILRQTVGEFPRMRDVLQRDCDGLWREVAKRQPRTSEHGSDT